MSRLILLFACIVCASASAETPIDTATAVRNTVLRSAPNQSANAVGEVKIGAVIEVYERQRLWVRVAMPGQAEPVTGWLRFTELRFGHSNVEDSSKTAKKSSGFVGFSRSVSGFLSSFRDRGASRTQTTSTIGIRGLTASELAGAAADPNALGFLERYAISKSDAEKFASAGGLRQQTVRSAP